MSSSTVRVGVGTKLVVDGDAATVVEIDPLGGGSSVVVLFSRDRRLARIALRELFVNVGIRLVPDGPGPRADDISQVASVRLSSLTDSDRAMVRERTAHVREVLTGYTSGSSELPSEGEPREAFDPKLPLMVRYQAKSDELNVTVRTIQRWVNDYHRHGPAGLAKEPATRRKPLGTVDERWLESALEVMAECTDLSKPSRAIVIASANARVQARFGDDAVKLPGRATAYRVLSELEHRHPTFRLSTKRNRDIAGRPAGVYGKLRPTRPGEYMLMDTTPLDVFALDPVTLRWVQAELTVAMDWYSRCITGVRLTPMSTKAVDAAAVLYQAFRPPPAGPDWPEYAAWPEHGIPKSVLIDRHTIDTAGGARAVGPAIAPETLVIDHGKIYVSDHLTSVCQRLGISVQPARLRTGRDKGPVERFFRTIRESLLEALPGYKGPDIHSRGSHPETQAFFYLDELETIIREWIGLVYHHRPHSSLVDPHLPGLHMSPATMYEHGIARAGFVEVPRDPDLAYEFMKVEWRKIHHCGVESNGRRYTGECLQEFRNQTSPFTGKANGRWPIHHDPGDITRMYFRHPTTRVWHTLQWEHAPSLQMPMSEEALQYARKLASSKYRFPDDRLAVADLFQRWSLGLGSSAKERRMALRLSRNEALLLAPLNDGSAASLPSAMRAMETGGRETACGAAEELTAAEDAPVGGDDDSADEADDFYADALEEI